MNKKFHFIVVIVLFLLYGCSSKEEFSDLSFGGIALGYSEKQIIEVMGDPTSAETKGTINEIYYKNPKGSGVIFDLENDLLIKAVWYPFTFDSSTNLPLSFDDIDFSQEYTTDKVSCYHTAQCNVYIFEKGTSKLQIQMDWGNKNIDRVLLGDLASTFGD